MKSYSLLLKAHLGVILLLAATSPLRGDITVRLSVKFILWNSMRPTGGDIGTPEGFDAQIAAANAVLAATGRGFKLEAVYEDIQPPDPEEAQLSAYWFDLDARPKDSLDKVEAAALAQPLTWKWNSKALNVYVNNSESGQCSSPGKGYTMLLGKDVSNLTVLHEVGHFFGLAHTHAGDTKCDDDAPSYLYPVADGDGLGSTIPDHNCLKTLDGLSKANFNGRAFADLNSTEQAQVNSSWQNVMSYHTDSRTTLNDEQMDWVWEFWSNYFRNDVCTGRVWFVAPFGDDNLYSGAYAGQAFRTIPKAMAAVSGPDDVIQVERSDTYYVPADYLLKTACTLRATGGPINIVRAP